MRGESRIEIGGVARAHGIRGEVVIVTHDPDSETLGSLDKLYVGDVEYKIRQARDTQRGWLVALEGVATRNDAEALQGKQVSVDRDALALDPDDVLLDDLIDCEVRLPDGTSWGKVAEIMIGAHQDLLVIHDGDVERLLPLVDQFVTNVDLEAGVVTISPPDDLPVNKR
jgi:16S rRNA processing protein RimM